MDVRELYQCLNVSNLHLLKEVYSVDVDFVDPFHRIQGLDNLTEYFRRLYSKADSVDFQFNSDIFGESCRVLEWVMKLQITVFRKPRLITVSGCSVLHIDEEGKICRHQDYFDAGAMLYEHLPLVGLILKAVKGRL